MVGEQLEVVDGGFAGIGLIIVAVHRGKVYQREGIAVGIRVLQKLIPGEPAAAAGNVLNDDGNAEILFKGFRNIAAAKVGRAAGRIAAEKSDGLAGPLALGCGRAAGCAAAGDVYKRQVQRSYPRKPSS